MADVTARIKIKGINYEIQVDLDEALKVKEGKGNISQALRSPSVYHDLKKGEKIPNDELISSFGTTQIEEIVKTIITKGEVQKNQEYRDSEKENRIKQVVSLIVKNAVDQHGRPYTEERLRRGIEEIHYNFDNRPAEQQMNLVVEKLKTILPIKLETKRVKLTIPAQYTGQVYGLLKDYKESEEWLANGALSAIMNVPSGLLIDFYDKLNNITHGAVQSQELSQ
jgi:ribosome maturation protein SDO1